MAYLGKVSHERSFKCGRYVVRLSPDAVLGIRRVGERTGLAFFSLADLMGDSPGLDQFHIAAAVPELTLPPALQ